MLLAAIYLNLMLPLLLIYLLHAFYRTQGKGKGDKVLFTFLPFCLFPFNSYSAFLPNSRKRQRDKVLFTFLPFYLFTFNSYSAFLPNSRQRIRAKALLTFLPFYLFTFINSLAAYPQSSAATSLPAPPGELAYTRLALPG